VIVVSASWCSSWFEAGEREDVGEPYSARKSARKPENFSVTKFRSRPVVSESVEAFDVTEEGDCDDVRLRIK
jgi:hypothetical protein